MPGKQTHVLIEPHNQSEGGYIFKRVHERVSGNHETPVTDHIEPSDLEPWDFNLNARNNDEVFFYVNDFEHRTFCIEMKAGEPAGVFEVSNRPLPSNSTTVKADGDPTAPGQQWGTVTAKGFQSVVCIDPHHGRPGYCCLRLMAAGGGKTRDHGGPVQHKFTVTVHGCDPHDPDIEFEC